jgi:hypothetical protein
MHRLREPELLLFAALLVLHVAPIWYFPYFPSQDGPTHLENAVILRDYHRPDRPLLRDFYTLRTSLDPNWFGHLALRGLMAFLPVLAAEKVLLTGYVLLLPLAARYALAAVRPAAGALAVLVFPFLHHFLYHMGFYNFCYSLAVFFLVVGYWLKHEEHFRLKQTTILAGLVVVLYFCHLVAVGAALMTIAAVGLVWLLGDALRPRRVARFVLPLVAFAPALVLGLAFVGRQGTSAASRIDSRTLARWLGQIEVLVSYLNLERLLATTFFAGLAVLSVGVLLVRLRGREMERRDALLAGVALTVAAYFAAPSELSGGSFLNTRLMLFPFFLLILWLGVHPFATAMRRLILAGSTLVALGFLGLHTLAYAEFNAYLADYLSVEPHLPPNTTLLPLPFTRQLRTPDGRLLSSKVSVFRHAAGYLAARCGVVELENYEATTGYFPVHYRDEVNPYHHLNTDERGTDVGLQAEPPRVDFLSYPQRTGRTVDFVLLWNVQPEQRSEPAGKRIFAQIDQVYEHIFTSPRGLLELYRSRDLLGAP